MLLILHRAKLLQQLSLLPSHQQGYSCCCSFLTITLSYNSKNTPIATLYAKKIAKTVLLYVLWIAFPTSPLKLCHTSLNYLRMVGEPIQPVTVGPYNLWVLAYSVCVPNIIPNYLWEFVLSWFSSYLTFIQQSVIPLGSEQSDVSPVSPVDSQSAQWTASEPSG